MAVSSNFPEPDDLINTAVFHIVDTACFLWETMDDAYVIYDKRSGHSQVLNDFAREIFALFEDGPCSLPDLLIAFEEILERPVEDELKQQIRQTIVIFDSMGLIEPIMSEQEK
ncbi:MAG: hypothetical protein COA81_12865 [Alphaproteobacteria bacterium]|nr:MAG: hypothetical protein COA81_12865 [Alphaproteobacteria bacterium]